MQADFNEMNEETIREKLNRLEEKIQNIYSFTENELRTVIFEFHDIKSYLDGIITFYFQLKEEEEEKAHEKEILEKRLKRAEEEIT